MNHCAVSVDLHRYMKTLDESEAKEEAIEEEAEKLMEKGKEFYPFSTCNTAEAMGEMSAMDFDRIAHFFDQGNVALAGGALLYIVKNYWQEMANKKAEETIDRNWQEMQQRDPDDWREDRRDYELDR